MQVNPDMLYVSECENGLKLRHGMTGELYARAESREEMDLKLASMGFEAEWSKDSGFCSIFWVKRIEG